MPIANERRTETGAGVLSALLQPPLWLAARAYGVVIAARNAHYDHRAGAVHTAGAPVISIGNLTTGGTGKTPMTIHVVGRLRALGRKPAVVARGYGSRGGFADELAVIGQAVPGTPCIANPDRVSGARLAVAQHEADVIVLDDGFQHRRIARDLDVALLDATAPFGGGDLLPRGRLREPVSGLWRAHAIVLTRTDQVAAHIVDKLRSTVTRLAGDKPVLACVHRPQPAHPLSVGAHGENASPAEAVHLVSGIARPEAFERTVRALGLDVRGHARFPDHHRYSVRDAEAISRQAVASGARRILVTEKDAVKLAPLDASWPMPVDVLAVRIDFARDDGTIFDDLLATTLDRWSAAQTAPAS